MTDNASKAGARHSKRDMELLGNSRRKLREIDADLVSLGTPEDTPTEPGKEDTGNAAKSENLMPVGGSPFTFDTSIKAIGGNKLELKVAYGGPFSGKDGQGEYFSPNTDFDVENFPTPPVTYYHGFSEDGKPIGKPIYIGKTLERRNGPDGHYITVELRADNQYAKKTLAAASKGQAVVSPGTVLHLTRPMPRRADGHLDYWPIAEVAVWDFKPGMKPANPWSVATPVLKALYETAGLHLPDFIDINDTTSQPEAAATGESKANAESEGVDNTTAATTAKDISTMDEKEIAKLVTDSVSNALKAQADAAQAEAERKQNEQARIDAAVKAEKDKWEAEAAKSRRLPVGGQAPHQTQFADTRKFDNMEPADNALLIEVLEAGRKSGQSRGATTAALKALALKLDESKEDVYQVAKSAMKATFAEAGHVDVASAIKANELNHSTQAGFGDEWVGVAYSTRLWEAIRQETFVAEKLMARAIEVPPGMESIYLPLEAADMTFYKVAQTTANNATTGIPDSTVTASKVATNRASLTLSKMGARTVWSGEMEEDSLIPFVANLRRQLELGAAETLEHVIIDGDTETGASTNINDIGGTPAGTEAFLLVNGFRKSPLVTTTANSRSGGTLTAEDYLETLKLMGLAGRNANSSEVEFITDLWTAWKSLELAEVKTRDVFVAPTIEKGELTGIYGKTVRKSAFMHYANQDATYGLKANTAGKTDLDTAANNTTGAILAVRYDQWQFGIRRRITIETQRIAAADATQIVGLVRFGLTQRDTEASAITYNLTV